MALGHRVGVPAEKVWLWQRQSKTLGGLAGYFFQDARLFRPSAAAQKISRAQVTGNFFSVLGVEAFLGRTFRPQDLAGKQPGAMLSYRLWQRRFGADPGIAGRTITLDGQPCVVVGVLPPRFWALSQRTGIRTPGPSHAPPNRTRSTARSGRPVLVKSRFFARREDPGSSADRGAGLWPATPASVPASNPMAAGMPPWPARGPAAGQGTRPTELALCVTILDQSGRDLFEKTER